jgi:hypothetical protein
MSKPPPDPLSSWMSISVFGLTALCLVAVMGSVYLGERHRRVRRNWSEVRGSPTTTRTVKNPPTERFPITMYGGECSVEYTVAGKHYSIWAASGYFDPDPKFIGDRMQVCPVSRYAVHYNPQDPSDAFAERVDGVP